MQTIPLGRTGLTSSAIVFGGNVFGWTADEATSFRMLDRMYEAGLTTIDTADFYSRWVDGNAGGESETMLGRWFAANPGKRDSVTLITKVGADMGQGHTDLSPAWIAEAVEASLKRLQTGVIDLYLSHFPDDRTPDADTLGAFDRLREAGKIRAIGTSNRDLAQMQRAAKAAEDAGLPRYEVLQNEYNLHARAAFEGPLADWCAKEGVAVLTYFSLASGFLTGKYRHADDNAGDRARIVDKYMDGRGMRILTALDEVAQYSRATPAEVALAWLRQRPGVTAPIASASSERQLDSLIRAADLTLSEAAMELLNKASVFGPAQG
ncbi:aldo/keto reductase [Pseudooceanicola algae]|uniref:1-deoxyxylulose-5-phosphate synthase YajO n=1 Tax=Pseudooceanicola algae TaxID=1537215 RepID=A0A418SE36_9RHOB|nr:aldo/keto reductase [Pseudooceanicola algae]QPM89557.1 1-deoxyxylulose-5-phosphate synthase YajO [Pseudooceanicola algae]